MPFTFTQLELGVVLIETRVFSDNRGHFFETYKHSDFAAAGLGGVRFVQENQSASAQNVVRGLHYQKPPKAQGKLMRVTEGVIWDVAVDLREGSTTQAKWVAMELSAENKRQLYVPPWCAHGFMVLSAAAQVVYMVTEEYSMIHEGGISWDDPQLGIAWPARAAELSARDQKWPSFAEAVKHYHALDSKA